MLKIIAIALWLLIVYNLFIPFAGTLGQVLFWLGPVLLIAHLVEFFLFKQKIKAQGDSTLMSFVMTMLFGVVYFGK